MKESAQESTQQELLLQRCGRAIAQFAVELSFEVELYRGAMLVHCVSSTATLNCLRSCRNQALHEDLQDLNLRLDRIASDFECLVVRRLDIGIRLSSDLDGDLVARNAYREALLASNELIRQCQIVG